jgi:DNA-binding transcriptional LysR family regulator
VGNFEAACRMIAAGVGIGIVPESVALRHGKTMDIAIVRLNDAWSERKLKICVRCVKDLPQFSRELVNMLRNGDG